MGWLRVDGWLLFQTSLYVVILACGLTTSISSGLAQQDFGGTCILYGDVNCTMINSTAMFLVSGGQQSICTFITAVNLLISVFFGTVVGGYTFYFLIQSRTLIRVVYQMWLKILLVSCIIATFVTLVSACTLTVGMSSWCNTVTSATCEKQAGISSCAEMQSSPSHWYSSKSEVFLEVHRFYDLYSAAEASCWISMCLWLVECTIYIRHIIKNRQMQRSFQDPFTIDDQDTFT